MDPRITEKIQNFFAPFTPKTYGKGAIIAMPGDDPPGVSLLERGVVEQYCITPDGNKIAVNLFRPTSFFPMSWAINGTPNEYFFGAVTEVTLRHAGSDMTVAFLRAEPDVAFDLLSRVYKGTDGLLKRLVMASGGVAANRLVLELLIEAYRFGEGETDGTVRIRASQHAMATRSGLARETVNRELQRLEREQLLERSSQGIVLHIDRLEQKLKQIF